MLEALESLERARGHLYSFHQLIGKADLELDEVLELLEGCGETELAEGIRTDLLGRNVVPGRWTFQLLEEFDDGYWEVFRAHQPAVREALVAGRRACIYRVRDEGAPPHARAGRARVRGRAPGGGSVAAPGALGAELAALDPLDERAPARRAAGATRASARALKRSACRPLGQGLLEAQAHDLAVALLERPREQRSETPPSDHRAASRPPPTLVGRSPRRRRRSCRSSESVYWATATQLASSSRSMTVPSTSASSSAAGARPCAPLERLGRGARLGGELLSERGTRIDHVRSRKWRRISSRMADAKLENAVLESGSYWSIAPSRPIEPTCTRSMELLDGAVIAAGEVAHRRQVARPRALRARPADARLQARERGPCPRAISRRPRGYPSSRVPGPASRRSGGSRKRRVADL